MVPVQLVGSISSGSVKPDDTFQVQAAEGVVISDVVIIRQGAGGQGHTVDANSAGGSGRSGSIALALDYVYSIDGGRIRLSRATQKQTEEDRKGASSTATIVGILTLGIVDFSATISRSDAKTIDPKTIISAFVAENVRVDTSQHTTTVRYNQYALKPKKRRCRRDRPS